MPFWTSKDREDSEHHCEHSCGREKMKGQIFSSEEETSRRLESFTGTGFQEAADRRDASEQAKLFIVSKLSHSALGNGRQSPTNRPIERRTDRPTDRTTTKQSDGHRELFSE